MIVLFHETRAQCFACLLGGKQRNELSQCRRGAEIGDPFFCSSNEEDILRLSRQSASALEREGFFQLGMSFHAGWGCEIDGLLAKENFLIAAELGHVAAAEAYGHLCSTSRILLVGFGMAELH